MGSLQFIKSRFFIIMIDTFCCRVPDHPHGPSFFKSIEMELISTFLSLTTFFLAFSPFSSSVGGKLTFLFFFPFSSILEQNKKGLLFGNLSKWYFETETFVCATWRSNPQIPVMASNYRTAFDIADFRPTSVHVKKEDVEILTSEEVRLYWFL